MKWFRKEVPPAEPVWVDRNLQFELPVVAQSEVDFGLIRELAFLEGATTSYPQEQRVIGTQKSDESWRVPGIYPIWGAMPISPGALTITVLPPYEPDVFLKIRARAEERQIKAIWGAPIVVVATKKNPYGERRPL